MSRQYHPLTENLIDYQRSNPNKTFTEYDVIVRQWLSKAAEELDKECQRAYYAKELCTWRDTRRCLGLLGLKDETVEKNNPQTGGGISGQFERLVEKKAPVLDTEKLAKESRQLFMKWVGTLTDANIDKILGIEKDPTIKERLVEKLIRHIIDKEMIPSVCHDSGQAEWTTGEAKKLAEVLAQAAIDFLAKIEKSEEPK